MSTEATVIEQPTVQPVVVPAVAVEKPAAPPVAVVLKGGIEGAIRQTFGKSKKSEPAKETAKEAIKQEPVVPDKPEDKKDAPKTEEKVEPTKTEEKKPEQSWAELRTARENAEKRAKELEAELATTKKSLPPEDWTKKEAEMKERIAALEKRENDIRGAMGAAALERHPDFVRKYRDGAQAKVNIMADQARAAGIEEAAILRAFQRGDENAFGEWQENMTPAQKAKFNGAWSGWVELQQERSRELENASGTWEKIEAEAKEKHAKAIQGAKDQAAKDARETLDHFFRIEGLPEDKEFRDSVEDAVLKAAGVRDGVQYGNREWLGMVAGNHALQFAVSKQNSTIEELQAKVAELEKSKGELEQFVKDHNGSVPVPGNGTHQKTEEYVPLTKRIRVVTP